MTELNVIEFQSEWAQAQTLSQVVLSWRFQQLVQVSGFELKDDRLTDSPRIHSYEISGVRLTLKPFPMCLRWQVEPVPVRAGDSLELVVSNFIGSVRVVGWTLKEKSE